jgi:DNA-directed RNA polymerase subunit RPC12/RpoP
MTGQAPGFGLKCPYCGFDARKVKECYIAEKKRHVVYYVCMSCGNRFKHVVGGRREVVVKVDSPDSYYLLFKGTLENFLFSLRDFAERRSELIRQFSAGIFLWGASRMDSRIKAGIGVFLCVTKNQYNEGGLALYGRLLDVKKFSGRYWPSGKWNYLLPIRVERVAEGVLESPSDLAKWRLPDRRRLEELGVRILPGIRTVKPEQGEKLKNLLKPLR